MKNALVLQSGGPTSVINSSLYGVIEEVNNHKDIIDKLYASIYGIDGLINDELIDITSYDGSNLINTPGAIIGSTRHVLSADINDRLYDLIINNLIKYNIGYFYIIGGNDSMDTANKMHIYLKDKNIDIKVIGIPKTIDNDIEGIDHTPGFGSAAKYVINALTLLKEDMSSYKKGRVTVVEIMGRDSGWLTACAKLVSSVDLIIIPEVPFDMDDFLIKVEEIYKKKQSVLVCVSEGIKNSDNEYISSLYFKNEHDDFNHIQLGGVSHILTSFISKKLKLNVRAIELNLLQRCFSIINSKRDVMEAINCGKKAVLYSLTSESGKMVTMKRSSSKEYNIDFDLVDLNISANNVKKLPNKYISGRYDISDSYKEYVLPLIEGEIYPTYENGIIKLSKKLY